MTYVSHTCQALRVGGEGHAPPAHLSVVRRVFVGWDPAGANRAVGDRPPKISYISDGLRSPSFSIGTNSSPLKSSRCQMIGISTRSIVLPKTNGSWAEASSPGHDESAKTKATSPVRIQWDPERDLRLQPLAHRAIQIGPGGVAVGQGVAPTPPRGRIRPVLPHIA